MDTLEYAGSEITDKKLQELQAQTDLRTLVIWGGSLTQRQIGLIGELSQLRGLVLGEMPVDDSVFAHLAKLKGLEYLNLAYTKVSRGFGMLRELPLSDVRVEGCLKFSDEAMQDLASFAALRHLEAHITSVSDKGVQAISSLPLEVLWLGPKVTDACAASIATITTLRHLDLCAPGITDAALPELTRLTNLQILWLSGTCISDAGVETLTRMQWLRELSVSYTGISREGRQRLIDGLPNSKVIG